MDARGAFTHTFNFKAFQVLVRWIPSHVAPHDKELPNGVSKLDVLPDAHADTLAGEAPHTQQLCYIGNV